jgi:hypothetical protein
MSSDEAYSIFHSVTVHDMHVQLPNFPVIWMPATALPEFVQCETKRYVPVLRLNMDCVLNSPVVIEKHAAGGHKGRMASTPSIAYRGWTEARLRLEAALAFAVALT